MVAPGVCAEPEREKMSGGLIELNDTEPNYINFADETDSHNTSNDSDEDL